MLQPATPSWPRLEVAAAQDPVRMAVAMRNAALAGRQAYLAGRIPKRLYAKASSPKLDS